MKTNLNRAGPQQMARLAIGVELNESEISGALIDENGRIIDKRAADIAPGTTRAAAVGIIEMILALAASGSRSEKRIAGIGISTQGSIDPETRRLTIPWRRGWTRVDLRQMIEAGLSESGHDIRLPVNERRARAQTAGSSHPEIRVNSLLACLAAAEGWRGSARGKNNVIYLSLGDEIGTGIIIDGRVLLGSGGNAGNAAWLCLGENFRQEYERRGCLAAEATSSSLVRHSIEGWDGHPGSMLGKLIEADPSQLDARTIIRAARGGDPLAQKVVGVTCRWIGRGLANLISILNPEAIVIGGELGISLKPFFDEIRDEAVRWSAPETSKRCKIAVASLGGDAALIGAGRLALG